MGIPGKGFITSMGLKDIIRSKKIKKSRFAINNFNLKAIYKTIKEFEDFTYESYVMNSYKHIPFDSYFYLVI